MKQKRPPGNSRARRGGVLLVALIASMAVAATVACLLQINIAVSRRQAQTLDQKRAFYLAEAGLAEAFSGITIGKTGNVGTPTLPAALGTGVIWVEAEDLEGEMVSLTSTALCGRSRAMLSLVAERGELSVASLGVFADQALVIPPGTTIEGFDSSQPAPPPGGPPAPSVASAGRVGSNAEIQASGTLALPTVLRADLASGPEKEITLSGAVTHVGAKEKRSSTANLPAIEPPYPPGASSITHKSRTPLLLQSPEIALNRLQILTGAQVNVRGPCNLVVNELTLAGTGKLELDTTGGPIGIWVTTKLALPAGSFVATSMSDPADLLLQTSATQPVQLASTGTFTGIIYAPAAQITVGSKFVVRGSLAAKQLVLSSGVRLSFDQHLDQVALALALPTVLSWRILELGDADPHSPVSDPFALLDLDPTTLPTPAQAHADQRLTLTYVDQGNLSRTYDGLESNFDWDDVKAVVELSRDGEPVIYVPESEPAATVAAPPASTEALDAINDPDIDSSDLRDMLEDLSPLTSDELVAAIDRAPAMNSSHLRDVLEENEPLDATSLNAAIDRAPSMNSSHLKSVLIECSPLPPSVLARIVTGIPALSVSDRLSVLSAQ